MSVVRTFSIAELEQFTLIKAHTFRTWEQRFPALKTRRGVTNLRFYTIEDLEFWLNFSLANRLGNKVSAMASMNATEIHRMVGQLRGDTAQQELQINRLILAMFSLDVKAFEQVLDHSTRQWGLDQTIEEVILPFLERLQFFSQKGRKSLEYHIAVTAIRKKLLVGIEQASPDSLHPKSALLFLPKAEHFDLLLLYTHYQLHKSGFDVWYLGTDLSVQNLEVLVEKKKPDFLVMYVSNSGALHNGKFQEYLQHHGAPLYCLVAEDEETPAPTDNRPQLVGYKNVLPLLLAAEV